MLKDEADKFYVEKTIEFFHYRISKEEYKSALRSLRWKPKEIEYQLTTVGNNRRKNLVDTWRTVLKPEKIP